MVRLFDILGALLVAELMGLANAKQSYQVVEFGNVGFSGTYKNVKKISNEDKDSCTCNLGDEIWFSGENAPLNEGVSVHFRGPLSLSKFAFYTSPSFDINDSSSSQSWNRTAYYDASNKTANNVTFLTNAGDNSSCLGKALTYADSTGTGKASDATILGSDNLLKSDEEFSIFSEVKCPKSGYNKACGVYRSGIPAYHGFDGETKMFLFEFTMPTASEKNSSSIEYYDMPAIWLLNDHIPRTSQYPTNPNCSCWNTGCGEFDIFEVMNGTERNNLYSTFHTFQGIEYLGYGIQADGYIPRDTEGTMKGGVLFDSKGNTVVFMSNDTTFDTEVDYNTIQKLTSVSKNEKYDTNLATISATAPTSTSKSGAAILIPQLSGTFQALLMSAILSTINFIF
ncbi:uncharacterized protein YJL171C [Kluyveromyces marxianus DMKU3-1042]|uniref:glucan endo-1,3-beta-D-glucosidase n=1 Tax=Kluyveromyces marxianus (strain DMKU3-1042 / BCC 29191 / NBRC 104275) TaxID=1003335 RepID=W0TIA9_KLUMD|nr:uncharacterized protein KLMA_70011 [Kluyveromyces marxianus DMKU3-1042]BAO41859.1 uncharacterized protein YJL171C [Kluyveromyces marxianus DMKU3-1042]